MTQRTISLLAIVAVVLATLGGVYMIRAVEELSPPEPKPVPVPVEVAPIVVRPFTHRLQALGTVQAVREAAVGAKVSGPISRIPPGIELGAQVEQGELLAEVDPTTFRIEVRQREALVARAQAQLRARQVDIGRQRTLIELNRDKVGLAKAEHERLATLFGEGGIARQDVERAEAALRRTQEDLERAESGLREATAQHAAAEAELASAQAELHRASQALADTRVRAPFTGAISEKRVTLGEQVTPGTVLFRLADLVVVKVEVRVPQDEIGLLRPGVPVEVRVAGLAGARPGRIAHLGPRADMETRTFPAEVLVENRGPGRLLPGMFARVSVPVHSYERAILVPRASVLTEDGVAAVFVADPDTRIARRRPVSVARTFGAQHLIARGLEPGEYLVVTGQRQLRDGAAIRVVQTRELEP